jgi:glycosyltransferase involved in cell wall biosynthesis
LPALELKRRTGKPLVLHIHSTEYDRAGAHSKNWVYELERKAMEEADWIIPVSNYTGAVCVNHYGAHWQKIQTVHNGIDLVQRTIKPKQDSTKYVIFFGRITMQKGPEYFVEAARKVLLVQPDVEFVMAGSGDLLTEMIERTARYGMGDKFFFTGFLNKKMLNELLAIADVYCMPSVSEPFGLSAVEAVQYGIPTIISKTSGVAEVLNGSLSIDFYDVNKFAEYIIQSLNDEGLKASIVAANNQSLKSITWENCAEKVMRIYNLPMNN